MNLTEMQLVTLLQYQGRELLKDKERKVILKSIKKNLKNKTYKHDRKKCYIAYIDNDKKNIIVQSYECKYISQFYEILNNLLKNELKNKIVVVSNTREIYFENCYNERIYTLWNHSALLGQLKEYGLKHILLKEKIDKKFDRLEKYLNILKNDTEKTIEEWKQNNNLDRTLKIMKQFNCELCFKFWKHTDKDINVFPVFYSNWTIKEYIEKEKYQALLKF